MSFEKRWREWSPPWKENAHIKSIYILLMREMAEMKSHHSKRYPADSTIDSE